MKAGTIGVDLGGSNLRIAAFAPNSNHPFVSHRELVGDDRRPEIIAKRLADAIESIRRSAGWADTAEVPVGIGFAGMLSDHRGTVARSPNLDWTHVPFGPMLADKLARGGVGPYRVGVYNDVNAIAWGELTAGAGRGARDLLLVFVGTGVGAGVVSNGALVEGASNCAGEIGHVKVAWGDQAALCACGQRGCVEAYVGGTYVQRRIRAELRAGAKSSVIHMAPSIDDINPGHVDRAASEGDEWALALWDEIAPLLAIAIGNAAAMLNPEMVVLGGGFLGRAPVLYDATVAALTVCTPRPIFDRMTVRPSQLEDDAGLVGAAGLATAGVSLL